MLRIGYLDCFSGAAGDMLVAACLGAGVDFDWLCAELARLDVGKPELLIESVRRQGIAGTRFVVRPDHVEHAVRHLTDIERIVAQAGFGSVIEKRIVEVFRVIGEAEAKVHRIAVEKVHFHEVGAVDSIVDVVGAHLALHQLAPERILSSSLHVGSGTVKCAHGVMPVPAPATALLLRGVPCYGGEVDGELVTPTGAALIAQVAEAFAPMPEMTIESIGSGSGVKDIPDRPNVLRVFIGEAADVPRSTESIVVMEANIDDMNPELFPPLISGLLEAGARDAFLTPILGKKGRPAHLVTVLLDEDRVDAISESLFQASTTLGVRMRRENRICLEREHKQVQTPWGMVGVKVGILHGKHRNAAPEYEDCARVAQEAGVPTLTVYDAARAAAVKGEYEDG
ncbi:MAG: nickel pincer cofactor biosynthesis protein LarC [Candidatus Hydrogenedentes bacterium]|nr:nickel pincer cofactor biosynthesis protein LarC [Candidatus Hydrogenedentota bacterium]